MGELVSCVLATRDRPRFLAQAARYFLRQTYPHKELLVVDGGVRSARRALPADPRIRYLRVGHGATLGEQLNLGVREARGEVVQKLDDDDVYHPEFLATTVGRLLASPAGAVVGFDDFLVLVAALGHLTHSGRGWCAGGTLCFHRSLWQRHAFRPLRRGVDYWFLQDNDPQRCKIQDQPELYILVRHGGGHAWNTMGDVDVDAYFGGRPRWRRSLAQCLDPEDLAFYQAFRRR